MFKMDRKDKVIVIIALFGFLFSIYLGHNRELIFDWVVEKTVRTEKPIGTLTHFSNKIKYRSSKGFIWQDAKETRPLYAGDSVFTGKNSSVQIQMKGGDALTLGEKSMVTFSRFGDVEIPNIVMGNMSVKVKNDTKMKVGGKTLKVKGGGTRVQIVAPMGREPLVRVVEGRVELRGQSGEKVELVQGQKLDLTDQNKVLQPKIRPFLRIEDENRSLVQNIFPKWWEHYQKIKGNYLKVLPRKVGQRRVQIPLSWSSYPEDGPFEIELSPSKDFEVIENKFMVSRSPFVLKSAHLGVSYWRVTRDGYRKSNVSKISVGESYRKVTPPELLLSSYVKVLNYRKIEPLEIKMATQRDFHSSTVEVSTSPLFYQKQTRAYLLGPESLKLPIREVGKYHIRSRGVLKDGTMTAFSPTLMYELQVPPALRAPFLRLAKKEIQMGETSLVEWNPNAKAKDYLVRIRGAGGRVLQKKRIEANEFIFRPPAVGLYEVVITARDEYSQESSSSAKIEVRPNLMRLAKRQKAQEEEEEREPASQAETVTRIERNQILWNQNFNSSYFAAESSLSTFFSTDQVLADESSPLLLNFGVRGLHWAGNHGLEGQLRTQVASMIQEAPKTNASILEARYRYRLPISWSPLSALQRFQLSLITGLEVYTSSSGSTFSPGYYTLKTGFGLNIPVFSRMDMGGDALVGLAPDLSTKFELSGFLSYFFQRKWSLGTGYRVHLFEAKTNRFSPSVAPYREAFGEIYSTLRYHY